MLQIIKLNTSKHTWKAETPYDGFLFEKFLSIFNNNRINVIYIYIHTTCAVYFFYVHDFVLFLQA